MDSLQDILASKSYEPPDEISLIKEYVQRRYQRPCTVRVEPGALIVSVRGSAFAATLQMDRERLIEACNIKQKLVIRGR